MPQVFMVLQEGTPGRLVSTQWSGANAGFLASSFQTWTDVTSNLCSGNSALNKVKLYRARFNPNTDIAGLYLNFGNAIASRNMDGIYSYAFICSHGRWHPGGDWGTTWTDTQ